MDFGAEDPFNRGKVPFSSHYIMCILSTGLITVHVDLDNLTDEAFVMFLHCKLTLFPYILIFGRKVYVQPTPKE